MTSRISQVQVEIRNIKDVTDVIFSDGTATKIKDYWNGRIPWLSSGETRCDFIFEIEETITKHGVRNSGNKHAKQYDIVVASAGPGNTRGQVSFCLLHNEKNITVLSITRNSLPKLISGKIRV